jgi:hypothetical protein
MHLHGVSAQVAEWTTDDYQFFTVYDVVPSVAPVEPLAKLCVSL